jgi:hypothetical protein
MTRVTVSRAIAASPEVVFKVITDIERLPDTNPDIVGVELLSDQRSGVGHDSGRTRRRPHTALMANRRGSRCDG